MRKGMGKALAIVIIGLSIGASFSVAGVTIPKSQTTQTINKDIFTSEKVTIDNPSFVKKMVNTPYLFFGIAIGDFYVDGNYLKGNATVIFELYMKYFIFPDPNIYFNREIDPNINSDDYFYYKMIYTNHTAIIIAIDLESTPHTPQIDCISDSTLNRLVVVAAESNIKWKDIEITLDKLGATYQVFDGNVPIAPVNNTASAGDAEVMAGEYIQLSTYSGNVTITLKYIPLSTLIGTWTVNV